MTIQNEILGEANFVLFMTAGLTVGSIVSLAMSFVCWRGAVLILPVINFRRASSIQIINVEEYTLYTTIFQCLTEKGIAYEEKYGQILLSDLDTLIKVRSAGRGFESVEVNTLPGKTGKPELLYELRPELETRLSETSYPKVSLPCLLFLSGGLTCLLLAASGWYMYKYFMLQML
jgi:hypothetical protein